MVHLPSPLQSLPFQSIQHIITAQDHQPTPDSCVMSMVMGQLKVIRGREGVCVFVCVAGWLRVSGFLGLDS